MATVWPLRNVRSEVRTRKPLAQDIKRHHPKKAAQEIRRLLEEGGDEEPLIGFTKNLMIFRKSGLLLTSRLDGREPSELSAGGSQGKR